MVYVRRKDRETTAAMLRRFTRRVQQSGVLLRARKTRFFVKPQSRSARRNKTLRRLTLTKERERLAKLGRLKPEERSRS